MVLKNANILVIDDDEDVLIALRLLLKSMVNSVVVNKNPNTIISLLEKNNFDIVILDMNFNGLIHTGNEGIYWLNKIKEFNSKIDVILITAYGDIDLAIRSLKEGASDFLVKPWKNEKLVETIQQILKKKQPVKSQNIQLGKGQKIIGDSEAIVTPFMQDGTYPPRNFATLEPL